MARSVYARLAERFGDRPRILSRREALRRSAAGVLGAAGLLGLAGSTGGCASSTRSGPRHGGRPARGPNGKSVIVVGAGFAGLACAYELLAFGYDVQIVEARSRVGGRVLTFKDFVPGKVVEGGAELIGSNHLTWQAYARQFGLRMLDVTSEDELAFPIRLGGRMLDEAEAERLYYAMDAALSRMNALAAGVHADEPWMSPEAATLDARTVADWIDEQGLDATTRGALRAIMASDNAAPVERQSLLGMLAQVAGGGGQSYWEDSEVYRCRGGNQQLADRLAGAIGNFRFLLNSPVRAIQYSEAAGRATVSTTTGQALVADEVVLTIPPSVWGSIFFDPGLPGDMSGSFGPQMGTAVKYLSHVKSRYWRDLGLAPDSLSDGPVAMTWEGTDNQGGRGASLHVFAGGPAAEDLRRGSRADVDARVRGELETIYPGYVQNLARGGDGSDTRFMDWPAEQWTGAGYSFPAPGQLTRMGARIHDGIERLRFAGEHASPAFVGYMEGGLRSGVLLAQRMALRDDVLGGAESAAAGG